MEELSNNIDHGRVASEDTNTIDEAEIRRIREDSQKAQQIAQQGQQQRKKDLKFAEFLTFLLKDIHDENLIASIYHVFFKTKNPQNQTTYLRKIGNSIVICGLFAPFYHPQIQQYWLEEFYSKIYNFQNSLSIQKYIHYIKLLSQSYHDNVPIDKGELLNFLINIILYYKLDNLALHNAEERTKIRGLLEKELF